MKNSGKIDRNDFEDFFQHKCGYNRPEVRVAPAFGVDVSVVDLPNGLSMALTSDPLSLIPSLGLQESAWLSVHLMANDMATTGCAPMYGQFVLNLPTSLSESDFAEYWNHIHRFCSDIQLSITGGHTGTIEGQNSTIAGGGTMITVAPKEKILVSKNAEKGDLILATKQCAISSSAILAMNFPQTVQSKLGKEIYHEACRLFYKTSSLTEGLAAARLNASEPCVTAMHDVTEGGMLGAVYEMAAASGKGARIYNHRLPIGDVQNEICQLFSIDPRYTIGAGSMIMTVKKGFENKIITDLEHHDIDCRVIGEITEAANGIELIDADGTSSPLAYQRTDPYWNAFFTALKNNWK